MDTLAFILAGGRGTRLDILSQHRAKPSVPFAGKYRLIDFALSNCINSGIDTVGILTQYLPMSLNEHIGIGKPWDLDRSIGGATILQPHTGKKGGWYEGTAHAISQNMSYIRRYDPDHIIILSGDHVYKMDYNRMIDYHIEKGADLTIAAQQVSYENASQFGILEPDLENKVIDFVEKPEDPPSNLASMGIYVFSADVLIEKLEKHCDAENSDFGHHIIPSMIEKESVYLYQFDGFWKDVGTLTSFWETNLSLTDPLPEMNMYEEHWKIRTRSESKPPVKFGSDGDATDSLISNGSIVNGTVENSVISPGVVIEDDAVVRDCVIFNDTVIKKGSVIEQTIIDKNVVVEEDCKIGSGDDLTVNSEKPELLYNGLNIIAKGALIPSNTEIQRNCRVQSYVDQADFDSNTVVSGSTVHKNK